MKPPLLPVAALLLLLCAEARAEVEVAMAFGHGGNAVAGAITPLSVRVRSREAEPLRVTIRASTGSQFISGEIATAADVLAPGTEKVFVFLLRVPGYPEPSFAVEFDREVLVREGDQGSGRPVAKWEHRVSLRGSNASCVDGHLPVLLAVGRQASALPRPRRDLHVFPVAEEDLPTLWEAYDGIDTVLWVDPGEAGLPDPAVVRALERFVEFGGRLVISATRRPEILAGSPLEALLPARLRSPTSWSYRAVAAAIHPELSLEDDSPPDTSRSLVPLLPGEGEVLLSAGDFPLAVVGRRGLGRIVVLAYDPREFPEAKGELARRFFRILVPDAFEGEAAEGTDPELFRDDPLGAIARLLRAGGIRTPPMALLSLFMILYVLAVGPIDYFVLKKLKLLRYSALTFLGLAVLFSAAAWFFSFYLFGGSTLLNRVTLIDVVPSDSAGGADRLLVNDLAGYYAPRGGTISLEGPGITRHYSDFSFSWSQMGGTGGALPRDPVRLEMTDPARPRGSIALPFRSLRTIWGRLCLEQTLPLDVVFEDGDWSRVRNGFPFRLRDAVILGPAGARYMGDIDAGADVKASATSVEALSSLARRLGGRAGSPPAADTLASLAEDDLTAPEREFAGRALLALSAGSFFHRAGEPEQARTRVLRRAGLDRGGVPAGGGLLLLAWTDEGDPLGLADPDASGFRITVIRKVLRP